MKTIITCCLSLLFLSVFAQPVSHKQSLTEIEKGKDGFS
ncbi:MAG: hypothetical protein RJB67_1230, partial [Bacteroidota bacterium]